MTYFTVYHWMLVGVFALIYFVGVFFALRSLKGQFLMVALVVLSLFIPAMVLMGSLSLDKNLKKAKLIKFENRRLLRTESILFSGYVGNTGDYKIGTVTLHIKLINHGMAVGSVKGSDFYQPNSFWDTLLSIGSSKKGKARPNTIEIEKVIAVDLDSKMSKEFRFTQKFPSYFKDVMIREKLVLH